MRSHNVITNDKPIAEKLAVAEPISPINSIDG